MAHAAVLDLDHLAASRRRNKALASWTDLQTLRSVANSLASGDDQSSIATALGISQPAVSKLARRARQVPDLQERTPREIILEREIGMITTKAMMRELRTFTYTPSRFDDDSEVEPEAYVPGLHAQLEEAVSTGLLSEGEYEELTPWRES